MTQQNKQHAKSAVENLVLLQSACVFIRFLTFILFYPFVMVLSVFSLINFKRGNFFIFFFFMYVIQNCFICRPSDSTESVKAGIKPRTVATLALTARRSSHLAKYLLLTIVSGFQYLRRLEKVETAARKMEQKDSNANYKETYNNIRYKEDNQLESKRRRYSNKTRRNLK